MIIYVYDLLLLKLYKNNLINNDIYNNLGEIDIIFDLLQNVYDDDSLCDQIKLNNNKHVIEEFSNI